MPIFSCGAVMRLPSSDDGALRRIVEAGDERAAASTCRSPSRRRRRRSRPARPSSETAVERMHAVRIGLADVVEAHEHWRVYHDRPPNASCQRRNGAAASASNAVGRLAEHREGDDRGDDLRRLAELLAVDEQIAEAFGRAHEFGGDDEHPAEAEAGAQRHHVGRQHGRAAECAAPARGRRGGRCGRPRRSCGRPRGSRPSRRDRPERTRRPRSASPSIPRRCRATG